MSGENFAWVERTAIIWFIATVLLGVAWWSMWQRIGELGDAGYQLCQLLERKGELPRIGADACGEEWFDIANLQEGDVEYEF